MIIFIALCAILFSQFVFKNKIVLKYQSQNRVVYYYSCKGRQFKGRIEVPDEGYSKNALYSIIFHECFIFSIAVYPAKLFLKFQLIYESN